MQNLKLLFLWQLLNHWYFVRNISFHQGNCSFRAIIAAVVILIYKGLREKDFYYGI